MLGKPVGAEVESGRDTHRRWLSLNLMADGTVAMREVELPADVDPEEWPRSPDDDPTTISAEVFPSLEDAVHVLTTRGFDTDKFDAVWKFPNPF